VCRFQSQAGACGWAANGLSDSNEIIVVEQDSREAFVGSCAGFGRIGGSSWLPLFLQRIQAHLNLGRRGLPGKNLFK
jgi:hypothetical protein